MKGGVRLEGGRKAKKNSSFILHPSSFPFVVGLVTCSSRGEARQIAKFILTRKLAACVNIIGGLESHYWWKGKLEHAREYLLLIKTTHARERAVVNAVKKTHSYEVPEVIFLPVSAGERNYLQWLRKSVKTND